MDLAKLAILKEKLVNATQFSAVLDYFLAQFGEHQDFIALGERTSDPFLETVLIEVGKELFQKEVLMTGLLLTRLPEQKFIHGACQLGGRLANVVYFEDIHCGLLAVLPLELVGETKYVRFSGKRVRVSTEPSVN